MEWSALIAGFVFGIIGLWLLKEAKKQANFPLLFTALALILYPYFIDNPWLAWGLGIGLCGLAYKLFQA
jgi:hypothetical protein